MTKMFELLKEGLNEILIAQYKEAGRMIKGARTKEDLTQKALAHKLNIPILQLREMENGKRQIGMKEAKKLAKVLNVDYLYFFSQKT